MFYVLNEFHDERAAQVNKKQTDPNFFLQGSWYGVGDMKEVGISLTLINQTNKQGLSSPCFPLIVLVFILVLRSPGNGLLPGLLQVRNGTIFLDHNVAVISLLS